ncbi:MAG: hypothetical protein JXB62_10835 [Pirellulales bacterium]|nr:hypothetical protein [Pirellulales bacterium]
MEHCWEKRRSATGGRRRVSMKLLVWLTAAATLTTLPGCGGCGQDPVKTREELEKRLAEERAKKKEKEKPDFEVTRLATRPSDRSPGGEGDPLGAPCKPGHWTATTLAAKTNNFDFVGNLETEAGMFRSAGWQPVPLPNTPFQLATARQVSLPKRQPKVFESVLFLPPHERQAVVNYRLTWRKGGRLAWENSAQRLAKMPSYQYHFVVLARWPARYTYLTKLDSIAPPADSLTSNPVKPYYRVSFVQGDRRPLLPAYGLLWTSTACVLWDDAEPGSLTLDQQQALLDWLHWGGQLIISGPDSLDSLRDSFLAPYLPATSSGARELVEADFQPLHDWANGRKSVPPLAPVRPLSGVQLEKHPLAEFISGSGDLLVERRTGRGRIVVSAFRLSGRDLTSWPGIDEMFNAFLLRRKARQFVESAEIDLQVTWDDAPNRRLDAGYVCGLRYFTRDTGVDFATYGADTRGSNAAFEEANAPGTGVAAWNDTGPVAESARAALRAAAQIEIPARSFVLWILAGYLVVLVPANWIVFRLAGRVEWAWAAAPLIAVLCTVVVIRAAQLDIGFARAKTEIALVEIQGNYPRAHVTRYSALYTSLTTEYDFHGEDPGTLVHAFPKVVPPGQFSDFRGLTYRRGKDAILENYFVRSNSIGMLHSEQMVDLGGSLSLVETPGGGWQIVNGTEQTLLDACAVRKDTSGELETAWLGLLEPGEKVPVQFGRPEQPPANVPLWQDRYEKGSPLTGVQRMPGELNLSELLLLAQGRPVERPGSYRRARVVETLEPGEVRLVAGLERPLPRPTIVPAAPQAQHAALVVAHLRFHPGEDPQPDRNTRATPIRGRISNPYDEFPTSAATGPNNLLTP